MIPKEDNMDVLNKIQGDNDNIKKHVAVFLENFINPAFGVLTKKEIEFLVFKLIKDIGVISDNLSLYDLMMELHITKAKAHQLLFDYDVRKSEDEQKKMDHDIQLALCNAKFAKDGEYFVLDIERPLLQAYLKEKIRKLGHIADGSFSQSIVRMNLNAVTALMLNLIPEDKQNEIKTKLIKAGAPDGSITAVVKSSLKKLGSKLLGEMGADIIVEKGAEMIGSLFTSDISTDNWEEILKDDESKNE